MAGTNERIIAQIAGGLEQGHDIRILCVFINNSGHTTAADHEWGTVNPLSYKVRRVLQLFMIEGSK